MAHTFLEKALSCNPSDKQSIGKNLYSDAKRTPLLLSTYSKHGIFTEDKIYSYEPGLGYEVLDHDYNELPFEKVPSEVIDYYIKISSQFYN
jgi:membrane-anchored protein YejM (alkaline phosphatase superfamily)